MMEPRRASDHGDIRGAISDDGRHDLFRGDLQLECRNGRLPLTDLSDAEHEQLRVPIERVGPEALAVAT